jgi:hypothetical protein
MPKKRVSDLQWRIVPKDEVIHEPRTKTKDGVIRELKSKFVHSDTGAPIEIGEAVESGPWDSVEEGRNWFKYYMPDTYKLMDWGKEKTKNNKTKSPITVVPHTKEDGKIYIWVIRETE